MSKRRLAAIAALVLLALALAGAVAIFITNFPRGLFTIAFVVLGAVLAWAGLLRRGAGRWLRLGAAAVLLLAALVVGLIIGPLLPALGVAVALLLGVGAIRAASTIRVRLPAAAAPQHAVLFWNPRSGGGKAESFHLPDEACRRPF